MGAVAFTGFTTGANTVVFTVSRSSGELKVGDLVTIAGAGVDASLTVARMRVVALTPDRNFTVRAPLGLEPRASHAGAATPVNIGMRPGSTSTGDAADGWKKTTSLEVWREDNRVNLSPGAYYALGISKDDRAEEFVATEPNVTLFRGKTVAFGAFVYHKVHGGAGAWRAFVRSDGTGGATVTSLPATGAGSYQWLEVSYAVPANATTFAAGVLLDGAAGDTYYMTDPVLAVGAAIGTDNYVKPRETFTPVVHISPLT